MAWYRSGTVSVTNGSATVTGSGTDWVAGVGIGEAFNGPDGKVYEIASIVSATQLTLGSVYLGATASGQAYQIIPSQSYIRDLAAQAAQLVSDYASVVSNAGSGKFTDGTAAAPGIRFTADENVGIRRAGADDMRLVANGQDKVTITGSGVSIPTLTSNPTLSAGTANGVLYLNGSKVATSGSALTFDGASAVIGNSGTVLGAASMTLGSHLSIANAGKQYLWSSGNSFAWSMNAPGDAVAWYNNSGLEQMRLTSTGLGIGTSSPSHPLSILRGAGMSGYAEFVGNGNQGNSFLVGQDATGMARLFVNGTTGPITMWTAGTERLRIDSSGNLGLGVTPVAGYGTSIQVKNTPDAAVSAMLMQAIAVNNQRLEILNNALPPTGGYTGGYNYTSSNCSATAYRQESGAHSWFSAPTGTAGNPISFTQAMTLDASGNLGIGTSSPATRIHAQLPATLTQNAVREVLIRADSDGANNSFNSLVGVTFSNRYGGSSYTAGSFAQTSGIYGINTDNSPFGRSMGLVFYTSTQDGTAAERARIDSSGNLLVGCTSVVQGEKGIFLSPDAGNRYLLSSSTSLSFQLQFVNANGAVGAITTTGTATAYNTSSDYRLKNITGPVTNSGAYIDSLNPVEGTWKADGSTFVGLIAHEVQEVSRTQVATGEKDGTDMQAMDYSNSELIANLIAEVQALRKRVAQLEAR